jgi:exonuclease III
VRLITWNVNRRVTQLAEQAAALAQREPDVVALQEVTARSWPLWRAALTTIGLPHALCSLDGADPRREPSTRRRTGVVIAAREPLEPAPPIDVPWRETTLSAGAGVAVVHVAHVPNAANGWINPDTLAALRAGLSAATGPHVLCGDLNTPRREHPDGSVISFARDSRGRLRPERGDRWDSAELGIVPRLSELGFADAFRAVHGYANREPSWTFRRMAGHGGGWRLDHIFASAELTVTASTYHHAWRDDGLSDHSPLEADLEPAGATQS